MQLFKKASSPFKVADAETTKPTVTLKRPQIDKAMQAIANVEEKTAGNVEQLTIGKKRPCCCCGVPTCQIGPFSKVILQDGTIVDL